MKLDVASFSKAVAAGTVAGGAPYLFLTVPLAVGDLIQPLTGQGDFGGSLYLAVLPLLIALALVLFGCVIIGVPTVMLLRRHNREGLLPYLLAGVSAGFLIPIVGVVAAGGEWAGAFALAALGAFSGGVTAFVWSRATERRKP